MRSCTCNTISDTQLYYDLTWHPGQGVIVESLLYLVILQESLLASVGPWGRAGHCGAIQTILCLILTSSYDNQYERVIWPHLQDPAVSKGCQAHNNLILGNTASKVVAYGIVEAESSNRYFVTMCLLCCQFTCVRDDWGHSPRVSRTGGCYAQ